MHEIPQAIHTNPAIMYNCGWYVGIPALNSVSLTVNHNGFDAEDVARQDFTGNWIYDINNLENKLHSWNYVRANVQIGLLSGGFRYKKYYFTFDLYNETDFKLGYQDNLLGIKDGNAAFMGEDNPLQLGVWSKAMNYTAISFGASRKILDYISVGAKVKYLSGATGYTTKRTDLSLYTDETIYDLNLVNDIYINSSFPMRVEYDSIGLVHSVSSEINSPIKDFIFNKNRGLALDLGVISEYSDEITFSASLVDLGFIRWKNNINSMGSQGRFLFEGFNIKNYVSDSMTLLQGLDSIDYQQELTDTLLNSFSVFNDREPYFTSLTPKIYIGASYQVLPKLQIGVMSRTEIFHKKLHPTLSLSVHSTPAKWVSFTATYNIMYHSADNLGLGLMFKGGPFQFYFVTDKIPFVWARETTSSVVFPYKSRSLSLRFGFNLMFNCKEKVYKRRGKHAVPCPEFQSAYYR